MPRSAGGDDVSRRCPDAGGADDAEHTERGEQRRVRVIRVFEVGTDCLLFLDRGLCGLGGQERVI